MSNEDNKFQAARNFVTGLSQTELKAVIAKGEPEKISHFRHFPTGANPTNWLARIAQDELKSRGGEELALRQ